MRYVTVYPYQGTRYVYPCRTQACSNVRYVYPYRRQVNNNNGLLLLAAAALLFIPFWGWGCGAFFW